MTDRRFLNIRQLGLLAAIPALMVIAPLIGFFGGQFLDQKLHSDPWGQILGLILGFAAAVREIRGILRKVKAEQ